MSLQQTMRLPSNLYHPCKVQTPFYSRWEFWNYHFQCSLWQDAIYGMTNHISWMGSALCENSWIFAEICILELFIHFSPYDFFLWKTGSPVFSYTFAIIRRSNKWNIEKTYLFIEIDRALTLRWFHISLSCPRSRNYEKWLFAYIYKYLWIFANIYQSTHESTIFDNIC